MGRKKNSQSKAAKPKTRKGGTFGFEETKRQDLLQKTADILGKVKGKNIKVNCSRSANEPTDVREDYGQVTITIGSKNKNDEESSKTKFERAVSPVLFETGKEIFSEKRSDLVQFAKTKHQNDVVKIADGVYSALEQRRLNSMMGYLYKGYEDRFTEADLKKAEFEFRHKEIEDPATALQAAQLGLTDKVAKSKFPRANDYVKDVERTGVRGAVILAEDYLKEIVTPWYQETYGEEPETPEGGGGNEGGQGDGEPSEDGTPQEQQGQQPDSESENQGQDGQGQGTGQSEEEGDGNAEGSSDSDEIHTGNLNNYKDEKNWKGNEPSQKQLDYLKNNGYKGETPETKGDASDLIEQLYAGVNPDDLTEQFPKNGGGQVTEEDPEEERNELDDDLRDLGNKAKEQERRIDPAKDLSGSSAPKSNEIPEQTLEESKADGESVMSRVEDAIAELSQEEEQEKPFECNSPNGYSETELEAVKSSLRVRPNGAAWHRVEIDNQTVNQLTPLLRKIRGKSKFTFSDEGEDVDVDLFIRNKLEGGVEYLKTDKQETDAAVVIGVDESGSMDMGSRMRIARSLCGTLYKAFDKIPNVEIHVIGWTSGRLHIIKSLKDVGSLTPTSGTPFREATMWIADYVSKLPHKKKLFFQITDGDVDYDDKMKRYIQNMKRRGIICTGVQVADDGYGNGNMSDLFGKKNCIKFKSMHDIKRVMIKQISKTLYRFLR